jgi:DNA polymerase
MQVSLKEGADLAGFRAAVRRLIASDVPPGRAMWSIGAAAGFDFGEPPAEASTRPISLPRAAAQLVEMAACHSDPERYALLYTLIWRLTHGERALLEIPSDPLIHRLELMRKSVKRDLHKMHAFLRFRRVEGAEGEHFVAWFEPEHFIVEATAQFFVDRFRAMRWTILTPKGSLDWDGAALRLGRPGRREDAPEGDAFEAGWRGYYESTFNPARTNLKQMRQHMPKKYWHNMSETRAIPHLVRNAVSRVEEMIEKEPAMPTRRSPDKAVADMFDQGPKSLAELNALISASEPLVEGGSPKAVLGEGPLHPDVAFVGEQPGDQEDLQGRPFVGPAGQLLMRAMEEAEIDRDRAYVTNAVKHFKFAERGKRRIHQTPTTAEVKHYRWWLEKEIDLVDPGLVVTLGATAALAMMGKAVAVTKARGPADFNGRPGFITVHPSYLLRIPNEADKARAYKDFVADLKQIHRLATKKAA